MPVTIWNADDLVQPPSGSTRDTGKSLNRGVGNRGVRHRSSVREYRIVDLDFFGHQKFPALVSSSVVSSLKPSSPLAFGFFGDIVHVPALQFGNPRVQLGL